MKIKLSMLISASCMFVFFSFVGFAQEAQEGDEPKGQLIAIHEDIVKPKMVAQYEAAAKELAAKLKEHNLTEAAYGAAMTNDFHYLYVAEIPNMAALDNNPFAALAEKIGKENMEALFKKFDGAYSSHKDFLARRHDELSVQGAEDSDDMTFRHWDFYYVYPGKEEEARQISKDWKALYEEKKPPMGYTIYTGSMGTEIPLYVVVQKAKDQADFSAKQAKTMELLGNEAKDLMDRTMAITRKYKEKFGQIRPDLSYMPDQGQLSADKAENEE